MEERLGVVRMTTARHLGGQLYAFHKRRRFISGDGVNLSVSPQPSKCVVITTTSQNLIPD